MGWQGRKRSGQSSGRQRCPKCRRRNGCGRGIARQHHAVPTRRMCKTRRPIGPTRLNRTRLSTSGGRRQNILEVRRVDKQGAVCTGTPHILCVCASFTLLAHTMCHLRATHITVGYSKVDFFLRSVCHGWCGWLSIVLLSSFTRSLCASERYELRERCFSTVVFTPVWQSSARTDCCAS